MRRRTNGRTVGTMVAHPDGTHSDHLTPDDVEQLAIAYHEDRHPDIRNRIAESFDWLVVLCANHARWPDEPIDDLAQVAREGLLAAIERFDPTHGVTLHTYAETTIVGTIRHYHRSALQPKVPRSLQELNSTCHRTAERLMASLHHTPTEAEIADNIGIGRADVAEALAVDHLFHPMSLSIAPGGDAAAALDDHLITEDHGLESTADRAEVYDALISLPSRQRTILFLHFYDGRTQAEIAVRLGISQVHVSRLMTAALASLRERMPLPDDGARPS
jgi:RNA polymerase sigma-B factor